MKLFVRWIVSALIILLAAYFVPGVSVVSFWTALIVALVLGVVNVFLKPLFILLTLPITIVTLGLFIIVINAVLVLFVAALVPGFTVDGFFSALLFGIVISFLTMILSKVT